MTEAQTPPAKKPAAAPPAAVAAHLNLIGNSVADLHAKIDHLITAIEALTARADEAEKLLSSPAAKVVRGAQKVWTGLNK